MESNRTGAERDEVMGDASFSLRARSDARLVIGLCLLLAAATFASYGPLRDAAFVNFDDQEYVYENAHVVSGLTWENVRWAFATTQMGNWNPLTWLSHMLDCELFGLNARGHHLTNLLLHVANTLLLFLILLRATRSHWRSGFVAALFALHPLHVESVAWVSERKDVLSTFFWMLTVGSYLRFVRVPSARSYLPVGLFFALGLMAKPMLVTLPFSLLLLDFWPLRRIEIERSSAAAGTAWRQLLTLVREKLPLFVLSGIASAIALWAQQGSGAVRSLDAWPLGIRIANAAVVYVEYIAKMFWPTQLAIYYPHPGFPPVWKLALSVAALVAISLFALRAASRRPALTVGWLWYLGTLLPVIGLVQIGSQAMADRYTYVPLIGLFIALAWAIPESAVRGRQRQLALGAGAAAVLALFSLLTWQQVGYWRGGIRLFERALEVTQNNSLAHFSLGLALGHEGRFAEALTHHEAALRIDPNHEEALYEIGILFERLGRTEDAIRAYSEAIRMHPHHVRARNNLAAIFARAGRLDEAIFQLREALRVDPANQQVRRNLEKIEEFRTRTGVRLPPARMPSG
ncbi:MAG: tetratricopeptide repeat protein [Deltaproteobacteria bacterium]|jgi:tetratricopeptide (TPR) repeat protein|nr:tetratricopeptide repeat protein [Deltaproteobacteria bacterium]